MKRRSTNPRGTVIAVLCVLLVAAGTIIAAVRARLLESSPVRVIAVEFTHTVAPASSR